MKAILGMIALLFVMFVIGYIITYPFRLLSVLISNMRLKNEVLRKKLAEGETKEKYSLDRGNVMNLIKK